MARIGKLSLNGAPRLVVSLDGVVSPRVLRGKGVDVVEFRLDLHSSHEQAALLKRIRLFKKFPSIATIRSKKEGGKWGLPEPKRLALFKWALPYVDAVDIELSSKRILRETVKAAHARKKTVIVSYHYFRDTPEMQKLNAILKKCRRAGADIVKIAALARSKADLQRLADFTSLNRKKNIVTIAMGKEGALSRILFPALGSLFTYASAGRPTAPGQLDFRQTADYLGKLSP